MKKILKSVSLAGAVAITSILPAFGQTLSPHVEQQIERAEIERTERREGLAYVVIYRNACDKSAFSQRAEWNLKVLLNLTGSLREMQQSVNKIKREIFETFGDMLKTLGNNTPSEDQIWSLYCNDPFVQKKGEEFAAQLDQAPALPHPAY